MWLNLLLASQDSWQARRLRGGTSDLHDWAKFFEDHRAEAALIGLGASVLIALLGLGTGKTPMGKLGKVVLYFCVTAALFVVLPVVLIQTHAFSDL